MQYLLLFISLLGVSNCIPPLPSHPAEFGDPSENEFVDTLVLARLPPTITPTHYHLEIRPILDMDTPAGARFTAPGKLWVTGTAAAAVDNITLNTVEIAVNAQTLSVSEVGSNTQINVSNGLADPTQQFYTVTLASPLVAGRNYTLYMEFTSRVRTDLNIGLYASTYISETGSPRYIASTDFQAPDARSAFPCFDEPQLKASWEMDIIRPSNYHALANMPLVNSTQLPDGWFKDSFAPTVPISTYLLCFAISDYTSEVANASLYNKTVTVWGPPPEMSRGNGKFSPDFSAKLMAFFESYYNIPYSLPKMDKISIPDYSAGAMENWGLNTYRDTRLLFEEGINTAQDMFSMTNTISHELVHQWWGNLVTCTWWNDLWIQEGAATYYAPVGVAGIGHTDLLPMETLITASVQRSFDFDANGALTHPIHNDGVDPENVPVLFDTLTYHKGASLIRMMNAFVSPGVYNLAMTRFLRKYEYSNADQFDMFAMIDEVVAGLPSNSLPVGVNVTDIMRGWTLTSGFPVVHADRDPFTNRLTLTQEKFFQRHDEPGMSSRWYVPISLFRQGDVGVFPHPERWLTLTQPSVNITDVRGDWVIVNPQSHGYYRVQYANSLLDRIIAQLWTDHTAFDVQIRSQLVDDNLNLGYSGYQNLSTSLNLTLYLRNERSLFPWQSFFTNMALQYRMFSRNAGFPFFKNYILTLTNDALNAINIDPQPGDSNPTTLLRTRLVEWRCNLGDPACIQYAKDKFALWMANPANTSFVFPDLQPSIYCTAVAQGGDKEWDFILSQYETAERDVMQQALLRALACSKTTFRLNTLLEMAINLNTRILNKHRVLVLQAVAGNSQGVSLAFSFLKANVDAIIRRHGLGMVGSLVTTLSTQVNSDLARGDLEAFVASVQGLNITPTQEENIKKNIYWMANRHPEFVNFVQGI